MMRLADHIPRSLPERNRQAPPRSLPERSRLAIRDLRGANYLPTWARTGPEHWGPQCRPERLGYELDLAAGLGFNAIRIWLSAGAWEAEPAAYEQRLALVLDAAYERGLAVIPLLFDSCGYVAPPDAEWLTVEQARVRGAGNEDVAVLDAFATPGHDLLDAAALVPVQWAGDAGALLWQGWRPNPGYDLLGEAHWPRWERYLRGVVPVLAGHGGVAVVELMNEPYVTRVGARREPGPVDAHIARTHELVRSLAPELPLAVGAERAADIAEHDRVTSGGLDVVSVHCYATGDALRDELILAAQAAAGRPVLLSEWGWFPGGTDEDQKAGIADTLPLLDDVGVGWVIFHLIAGYGPFPTSALLYPNGVMRPAARVVRAALT